jgi:cytidylate kinase
MTKTEYIISILPVLYFILVGVLYWRMSNKVSLMLNDLKELHEEGKAADEYLDSLANRVGDLEDRIEEDRVVGIRLVVFQCVGHDKSHVRCFRYWFKSFVT